MKLARQIIDALATDWKPEKYHDTYTEELRSMIDKKRKGKQIVVDDEVSDEATADVVDLMAALEESVKKARGAKRATPRRKKSA
jgi:DNA end-binding protein Ku